MIKYVKEKSGIEKPVWVDPLFLPSVACWMLYSAK